MKYTLGDKVTFLARPVALSTRGNNACECVGHHLLHNGAPTGFAVCEGLQQYLYRWRQRSDGTAWCVRHIEYGVVVGNSQNDSAEVAVRGFAEYYRESGAQLAKERYAQWVQLELDREGGGR